MSEVPCLTPVLVNQVDMSSSSPQDNSISTSKARNILQTRLTTQLTQICGHLENCGSHNISQVPRGPYPANPFLSRSTHGDLRSQPRCDLDLDNFFMTSNLSNKKFENPFLSLQPLQPTHNSTCLRK